MEKGRCGKVPHHTADSELCGRNVVGGIAEGRLAGTQQVLCPAPLKTGSTHKREHT